MDRLRDRVCLITGSTGSPRQVRAAGRRGRIGRRRFEDGDHAEPSPARCRRPAAAIGIAADLTVEREVDDAVAAAVARFGRIDGLFAVAGGSGRRFGDGPIHELTAEGWDRTLELNLRSQALTCRAVVRQMLAQAAEQLRHARLHPAHGQRHRDRPGTEFFAHPRLRGRKGRDDAR